MHSSSSSGNLPVAKQFPSTSSSNHTANSIQTFDNKETKLLNIESERIGICEKNIVPKDITSTPLPESSSDVVSSTMEEDVENESYDEVSITNRHDERRRKAKNKVSNIYV